MVRSPNSHIKRTTCDIHLWDHNVTGSVNHDQGMELKEGLVWYSGRIYIPRDHMLQGEINHHLITWSYHHWTSRHWENQGVRLIGILVGQNEERCGILCPCLWNLPMNQIKHPSKSSPSSSQHYSFMTMNPHFHRHDHQFTRMPGLWCYHHDCKPFFQGYHSHRMFHRTLIRRMGEDSMQWNICQTWNAASHHLRPRNPVHLQVNEGPLQPVADQEQCIHCLSPSNRLTDWMSQSRGRKVPLQFHQPSSDQLGGIAFPCCIHT